MSCSGTTRRILSARRCARLVGSQPASASAFMSAIASLKDGLERRFLFILDLLDDGDQHGRRGTELACWHIADLTRSRTDTVIFRLEMFR